MWRGQEGGKKTGKGWRRKVNRGEKRQRERIQGREWADTEGKMTHKR